MFKAKSLYHLIVYSILFIVVLISFFTFIIIENAHDELQEKISTLKSDFTNNQKELIKNDINSVISFIEYYHNKYENIKSEEEIKNDILLAIEKMKSKKNISDYIFIYSYDGTLLFHPVAKDSIGDNRINMIDNTGKRVIFDLIKVSKRYIGGYVDYIWYKPDISKNVQKISYANSYDKWQWTIGKGVYLDEIEKLAKYINLRVLGVYGGTNINTQKQAVMQGTDIIVATPGRLYDLALSNVLKLKTIQKLVIDEVDVMLDLGFRFQLMNIFDILPERRQNIMFSATMPKEVRRISRNYMSDPVEIKVGHANSSNQDIDHQYVSCYPSDRYEVLRRFFRIIKAWAASDHRKLIC